MKKLYLAVLFTLFLVSAKAQAGVVTEGPDKNDTLSVGVYARQSGKVYLAFENPTGSKVEIKIRDQRGKIIFNEDIKRANSYFAKYFNFEGMKPGDYVFELSNGSDTVVKSVTIK